MALSCRRMKRTPPDEVTCSIVTEAGSLLWLSAARPGAERTKPAIASRSMPEAGGSATDAVRIAGRAGPPTLRDPASAAQLPSRTSASERTPGSTQ